MISINNFIKVHQNNYEIFNFSLKAKELIKYSRIERARNGNKKNPNGVQRRLNLKRVMNLRKYLLEKESTIPVSFIVNICTDKHNDENFKGASYISDSIITLSEDDLIVIDGQHRLAAFDYENYNEELNNPKTGIRFKKLTNKEKDILDSFELIIVGYKDLSRIDMASVFISINNNQKKVSKSIIFDLLHIQAEDFDNITPEMEKILLTGIEFEEIKATSVIEELNNDPESCWNNAIKIEGGLDRTIELGSFVEHLSPALKNGRFLNNNDFPYHSERYEIIKDFFNILVDSVYENSMEHTIAGDNIYISKISKFLDKRTFLSKGSGVSIVMHKDFFDKIIKEVYSKGFIDKNKLKLKFKNFSYNDFSSDNEDYKGKLSSKAGYGEIRTKLIEQLG